MLNITIENGKFIVNGNEMETKMCQLGTKVVEVFEYFVSNRINLQLTKYANHISFNTERVDASKKLMRALEQDNLIRLNRLLRTPA